MNTSRKDPVSALAETNTTRPAGETESATRASEPQAHSTAGLRKQAEERVAQSLEETDALSPAETRLLLYELRVHQIQLEMQNEELRRVQAELDAARMRYFDLYDLAPVGYVTVSETGLILESNLSVATLLDVARSVLITQPFSRFILKEDVERYYFFRKKLFSTGEPQSCELRLVKRDGSFLWAHLLATAAQDAEGKPVSRIALSDITERKQAETYRDMSMQVLQILNRPDGLYESIQSVLAFIKTQTGADAVGLRLQDGEDFPYFAQQGFSEDFLLTENSLAERGADGGVCRDKDGKVCLECTCGLVISGKTDPSHPLFTRGGSFWTNDSAPLLGLPPDQDPRHHPRNECIHQGYASVALMPVRNKERIVGLLHLNCSRKGCFTLATVKILEALAAHIGESLMRKQAEAEQDRSHGLLTNIARLAPGVVYQYRLYPDGRSAFPYASPGMNDIYEVTPEEVREDATPVFGRLHPDDYGRVAAAIQESAKTLHLFHCEFRVILPRQGLRWRWSEAHPNRTADGGTLWYGTIQDITERKQGEVRIANQLEELLRWQKVTLGREGRVQKLKREVNQLLAQLGQPVRYASQADNSEPSV